MPECCFFFSLPGFKTTPRNRIWVSMRRQNVALIHSASPQRSGVIAEVKPNETGPIVCTVAPGLKLRIMLPCKSDFPQHVSCKSLHKNFLNQPWSIAECNTGRKKKKKAGDLYSPSRHPEKTSHIKENTGQLSDSPISISTARPVLEPQHLCVHIEACLRINVKHWGSLSCVEGINMTQKGLIRLLVWIWDDLNNFFLALLIRDAAFVLLCLHVCNCIKWYKPSLELQKKNRE